MPTARIMELVKDHVPKYYKGEEYVKPIYLSPERTRHYTESFKQTEGEPMSIRRAKALAHHLDHMEISIRPHELIVGNYASDPHVMPLCIEAADSVIVNRYIAGGYVKEEDRDVWPEPLDYWDKHNLKAMLWPYLTEDEIKLATSEQRFVECLPIRYTSRTQPDHELYLEKGVNGIIKMLKEKLEVLLREKDTVTRGPEGIEIAQKIIDVKAMLIAAEAFIRWTDRYSKLAEKMASEEDDPDRKQELLTISKICSRVPKNPAGSFWEAVQSHWFAFLAYHTIELACHGTSLRTDQIFWPWYEKDVLIDKTLPREKALEIMENLLIHIDEMGRPLGLEFRLQLQGVNYLGTYTIGGVKSDGSDACNDLTMLILDALDDLRLSHPDFKFRWHPKVNPVIWRKVCELIRSGLGQPSIKNDQVTINYLMDHYGYTLEEARSWAVIGCISPSPTLNWGRARRDSWSIRPAKFLELALNNGVDPISTGPGSIAFKGIETGDPRTFKTFDEVFEAFRRHYAWFMQKSAHIKTLGEYCNQTLLKRPLASCFFHRSLNACRDVMDVKEKGLPWVNDPGKIDCVDSLIAMKKLIFDDKKYTMDQLLTALHADWDGYEEMRRDFINAPKFGNDDDYADEVAKRAFDMFADEMCKVTDINDMSPMPSGLVVTIMFQSAPVTGALPNGRKLGDPLCDGGINPHPGYDKNGPMAAILSAAKIDSSKQKANVFNQKLTPASVAGETGLKKFQAYIETSMNLGLDMIQFNIVDSALLKKAQERPQDYQDLVVRVSGYNARFVDLDKFVQDAVMERTQHQLS